LYALWAVDFAMPKICAAWETLTVTRMGSRSKSIGLVVEFCFVFIQGYFARANLWSTQIFGVVIFWGIPKLANTEATGRTETQ
jgi:hypothetical protein